MLRWVYLITLSSCPCVDNPKYIEWYTYTYAMRWKSFTYLSILLCQLYRDLTFSDHLMDLHFNLLTYEHPSLGFIFPRLRWLGQTIPIHQVLGQRLIWNNIMYHFSLYYCRPWWDECLPNGRFLPLSLKGQATSWYNQPPPPQYTRLFPRFATLQRNFYTYTAKGQTLMGQSKQFYNIQQRPNESPVHPLIPSIIP